MSLILSITAAHSLASFNRPTSATPVITSPPQSHLGRAHRHSLRQRMHSSTACASCAMSTADKSSYSAAGTLHPYHFSPLTYRSLSLTLLTVLIPLQPPAGILQAWM